MNLFKLIVTRILKDKSVTLTQLEARAQERGLLLSDLYAALNEVHRDKRIKRSVKGGEIHYEPAPKPVIKELGSHLSWVTQWYKDNEPHCVDVPFPDINYSHLFLSPKEMVEYKAAAKGMPAYMYGKKRKQSTT